MQAAALAGLGAGLLFAFSAVFIKLANQALVGPSLFVRALFVATPPFSLRERINRDVCSLASRAADGKRILSLIFVDIRDVCFL